MIFENQETDAYGHKKLGGIGDQVSQKLKDLSPQYNNGRSIGIINQRLGYLVRSGDPDAIDSIVPVAYGNVAMNLIKRGESGKLVAMKEGRYTHVSLKEVIGTKKVVDVSKYYCVDRLRPEYLGFENQPFLIMA